MANDTKCSHCGKPAASHELEPFFTMPDVVFQIPKGQRPGRIVMQADLCMLDKERCFIRGVLYLPLRETEKEFGIGIWAEVPKEQFLWYCERFTDDLTRAPPGAGKLANDGVLPSRMLGLDVLVKWPSAKLRPRFVVTDPIRELYRDQQRGITLDRAHVLMGALLPS